MRTEPNRLEIDIGNHFEQQLRLLLRDTADTCMRVDMEAHDIMVLMLSVLMCEATRGGVALRMKEDEYIELARVSYQAQTDKKPSKKRH